MTADLHTHTNASDANLSRNQLLDFVAKLGIQRIAITDHDTMKNSYSAFGDPVAVIPGAELSAYDFDIEECVHILCYLPKDAAALEEYFKRMKRERIRVGEEILSKVEKLYPVVNERSIEKYRTYDGVVFKQSIMSVLVEYGYTNDLFGRMFLELFSKKSGSCNVKMSYGTADEVAEIARSSRGVVVLAHPSVYRNMPVAERFAKSGAVDGIEINHPRNREADKSILRGLASEYGLLATGGSDYHGANNAVRMIPGKCVTDKYNLEKLFEISGRK